MKPRGSASMDLETRRRVARQGGLAHSKEYMQALGRKGGLKISQDRAHMSEIGKKGGYNSRKNYVPKRTSDKTE